MNPPTYRIRNWAEHYETSESRKRKGPLPWVKILAKHDGKSFRRMTHRADAAEIYGAWVLMVAVAGKCLVRGVLADEDGPLTADDLEDKTGIPATAFAKAIELFSSERFKWLEIDDLPEPAGKSADVPENQPTLHNITTQDMTIQNTTPQDACGDGVLNGRFSLGRNATWTQIHTPAGAQSVYERAHTFGICTKDERLHIFRLILSLDGTAKNPPGALIAALRGEGKDPWRARGGDFDQQAKDWIRQLDVPPEMLSRTSDLATGPPNESARDQRKRLLEARRLKGENL